MMSSAPPSDLLLDTEAPTFVVRRGAWSIEVRAGELENIRHRGRLVLRSIRFVVRDENWRTVPSVIDELQGASVDGTPAEPLVIGGRTHDGAVSLEWRLEVGFSDDSLAVALRAESRSEFLRNRLGLIILHSPDLAGTAFEVRHPDGSRTGIRLPVEISPHQPAVDIAGLDWQIGGDGNADAGTLCTLDFSGDVFEMEDQRNWTDASFKTYSTPLSVPFPVVVRAGDVVEQSVVLRCEGVGDERDAPETGLSEHKGPSEHRDPGTEGPLSSKLEIALDGLAGMPIPRLTTMASTDGDASRPSRSASWADELLLEIDARWNTWRAALDRALQDAGERSLDVRIVASDLGEAAPVLDALAAHPSSRFARIAFFARRGHLADPETARSLVTELDSRGLDVQVIAGTRAHFTELNRGIGKLDAWRGPLTFSITPFMHDTAGHQLVESIAMQREVVENARRLAHGRPLFIGPITLGARFNAVATSEPALPERSDLADGYGPAHVPGASDGRTASASLAAWLLASVDALSTPGVRSLCYLEEWGGRSASDPEAARVLAWLAELQGSRRRTASAPGLVVLAVESAKNGRPVILVGNLTSQARSLQLAPVFGPSADDVVVDPGQVRRVSWTTGTDITVD